MHQFLQEKCDTLRDLFRLHSIVARGSRYQRQTESILFGVYLSFVHSCLDGISPETTSKALLLGELISDPLVHLDLDKVIVVPLFVNDQTLV